MLKHFFYVLVTLILLLTACSKEPSFTPMKRARFLFGNTEWVDSTLQEMTVNEKIGQLLVLEVNKPNSQEQNQLIAQAREGLISGLNIKGLDIQGYLRAQNFLQLNTKYPLLNLASHSIRINEQFKNTSPYPKKVLDLLNDTQYQNLLEQNIRKMNALGIDLVLEEDRSIYQKESRTKGEVTSLVKNSILTSLPFPENKQDTSFSNLQKLVHYGLSAFSVNKSRLDSFHKQYPEAKLSDWLEKTIQFDGLLVGTIQDTSHIQEYWNTGTHLFLVKNNLEAHRAIMLKLLETGVWTEAELNERVRKILLAKNWREENYISLGLSTRKVASLFKNPIEDKELDGLYRQTVKLVNLPKRKLPISGESTVTMVHTASKKDKTIHNLFKKYGNIQYAFLNGSRRNRLKDIASRLMKSQSETIIVLDQVSLPSNQDLSFLKAIESLKGKVSVINIGNPENLSLLDDYVPVVQLPVTSKATGKLALEYLLGKPKKAPKNRPINKTRPAIATGSIADILRYASPEEVGISSSKLGGIDALVNGAIQNKVIPGAQVMVIKDGKIIYDKAFGFHTYDKVQAVQKNDLYDIASITKVASTTLAFMKAYEHKQIALSKKINNYLAVSNNRLGNITMKQLLMHRSRLQANMPIGRYIADENKIFSGCNEYYCKDKDAVYNTTIADGLHMHMQWKDTLWQSVLDLKPRRRRRTRYSDVNFNILQKVIEKRVNTGLDSYVDNNFYKPLGLKYMTYQPRNRFPASQIVPTENDTKWRKQLLRGYVHDEAAALLGGVAGNAGIFSNAYDLGVLFQMLINGGSYGGRRFLDAKTIRVFSRATFGNHRGLGFDSKFRRCPKACSKLASRSTFGHTGFTGTCVWADPEQNLIFVFLSNRITPNVNNKKLFRTKLRSKIHNLIYQSLGTAKVKNNEVIMAKYK